MTLRDLLDRAAEANPSRPYLFFRDERVSLGAVVQYVDALAAALSSLGVRRDDHVAVLLPNRPEFLYSWFALATLGAVLVPVNPVLTPRELRQLLEHSDATGLIADGACLEVAAEAPVDTAVRWVAAVGGARPGAYDFADLLAGPAVRPPVGPRGDEAIAALVYTSGTTGAPRGVLKTHRSYTRVAEDVTSWLGASPDDRFFTALPLFHTNAQVYAVLPSLACGGSLVLAERFSASRFWEAVAACGATVFNYLGTMLAILARTPPTPAERWHRVRAAIGGGATADVERVCRKRFGVRLVELYALTETSTVTVRPLGIGGPPGSAGWPTAYCDIRILDERGRDCPAGSVGEIAVSRSEVLMAGYYKDPAAAAAAMREGWFLTGDLGWRDEHGALRFAGRKTELIRHRGEYVSPAEVEATLLAHPAVAEVAVVGRPSELGDEDVCAVVVPAAGAPVAAEALQAFCLTRLAPFKVPRVIEFRSALPRTATQKVRRELLRRPERAGLDAPRDAPCPDEEAHG